MDWELEEAVARSPRSDAKFRGIYDSYFAAIRNYCIRRLPLSEVNDAVAEVFLVVWRRIDDVPDGDQTRLWLYGVARNVTRNALRSVRRRGRLDRRLRLMLSQSAPDPELLVIRRGEDNEVLEALADLRPADREILSLSIWEELTNMEIGTVLGIDAHAATMRLKRARDRLAKKLGATEAVSRIKERPPTRRSRR